MLSESIVDAIDNDVIAITYEHTCGSTFDLHASASASASASALP
jgi:hypothetical protein